MRIGVAEFHNDIKGRLIFEVMGDKMLIKGELMSDKMNGLYGCHIHKYGDQNIEMLGGHYDKTNSDHPHHTGDLPNALFINGVAFVSCIINNVKLEQLYGRSVVIHKKCDDLKPEKNGHSGKIKDFAIIVRSDI